MDAQRVEQKLWELQKRVLELSGRPVRFAKVGKVPSSSSGGTISRCGCNCANVDAAFVVIPETTCKAYGSYSVSHDCPSFPSGIIAYDTDDEYWFGDAASVECGTEDSRNLNWELEPAGIAPGDVVLRVMDGETGFATYVNTASWLPNCGSEFALQTFDCTCKVRPPQYVCVRPHIGTCTTGVCGGIAALSIAQFGSGGNRYEVVGDPILIPFRGCSDTGLTSCEQNIIEGCPPSSPGQTVVCCFHVIGNYDVQRYLNDIPGTLWTDLEIEVDIIIGGSGGISWRCNSVHFAGLGNGTPSSCPTETPYTPGQTSGTSGPPQIKAILP